MAIRADCVRARLYDDNLKLACICYFQYSFTELWHFPLIVYYTVISEESMAVLLC